MKVFSKKRKTPQRKGKTKEYKRKKRKHLDLCYFANASFEGFAEMKGIIGLDDSGCGH